MSPKRPKPPDARAKQQKIQKQIRQAIETQYKIKRQERRCPKCGKQIVVLPNLDEVSGKTLAVCPNCKTGDFLRNREAFDEWDYYETFCDHFLKKMNEYVTIEQGNIIWRKPANKDSVHYFNNKIYRMSGKDFKDAWNKEFNRVMYGGA